MKLTNATRDCFYSLTLGFAALIARLWMISYPEEKFFDEVYYVEAALSLLNGNGDPNWVHPPFGKMLIALGIMAGGDNPFGWRLASAVSGAACVILIYFLALRLLKSRVAGFASSFLLTLDPLSFVHSRIAMLDIFLPAFTLAGYYFLLKTTEASRRRFLWLMLSGLAIGLGLSVKWSLVLTLIALNLSFLILMKERNYSTKDNLLGLFVFLLALPASIYMLSYSYYFLEGGTLNGWISLQRSILDFHITLKESHPYALHPLLWWTGEHCYYLDQASGAQIWAKSNPYTWIPGALAAAYISLQGLYRRKLHHTIIFLSFILQYFPWFFSTRVIFIYYMLPIVPFLHLSLAYCIYKLSTYGRLWKTSMIAYIIFTVLIFLNFYPSLTGLI